MPIIAPPPPAPGGAVLARLHSINEEHGYLPESALRHAAEELAVPLGQVYSAATFYGSFSLVPRGRHSIQVCLGTACYINGGDRLLERLGAALDVKVGETTKDRHFTLETAHCVGACGMSPVIQVDGKAYGRVRPGRLGSILAGYAPVPDDLGDAGE